MDWSELSTDRLEQLLVGWESEIAQRRGAQLRVLSELDARQVATSDGCRTMTEWVGGRLDLGPETAAALVGTARRLEDLPYLSKLLSTGEVSFERAVELSKLATCDNEIETASAARGWDVAGLRRKVACRRRITRQEEHRTFSERYLALQPSLDRSWWRLWGGLPGAAGAVVEQALTERADSFPLLPDGSRPLRGERQADALVSICQDSLTGTAGEGADFSAPLITVVVDASLAGPSAGEAGASIAAGPQVGPATLEALLCTGRVEVTLDPGDGRPLGVGRASRVISPRLRRYVLHRDGGCAAAGCTSRYRLQAHHVIPYSEGGRTDPANLTSLCWYHHHVVIHGYGYRIDSASRPGRIRFRKPGDNKDPP